MDHKAPLDRFGVASLVGFSLLLGFNQVVVKVSNGGFQPVFLAGMRSLGAILCLWLWMRYRGLALDFGRRYWAAGVLSGAIFASEFVALYLALDLTTVTRVSVIFYSMPVWMALAAHFLLPGEHLTRVRSLGLALALGGVAWAMLDRPQNGGEASLAGDLLALLGAFGWMGVGIIARVGSIRTQGPEMQMVWQLMVSAPILLGLSLFFGPFLREPGAIHVAGYFFQTVVVAAAGYAFWFQLIKRYPASAVASFAFLSPVFGVALGWGLLGEEVGPGLIGALVLVAVGITLINRR